MSETDGRIGLTRTVADPTLDKGGALAGDQPFARGAALGRYVLLDRLGAGGMGVVYAAFDPELDRRVALKVLRVGGEHASEGRARLLREAQALARVSHPNVVVVHDVGTVDGQVFVAMELVDGVTLTQWRKEKPRTWQEALPIFVAATRGLEAVHAAGLVHRDVKPDNVMVARDGRVRLMDLGLARADATTGEALVREPISARDTSPSSITQLGIVPGTPAYMAPELHARGAFDPRTDQFALGVTMYETLWSVRPFEGDTLLELATNVMEGRVRPPPRDSDVPTWLRRVVMRTLAVEPDQRYSEVGALLAELTRDRRRIGVRAMTVIAAAAVGVVVVQAIDREDDDGCSDAAAEIASAWDDSRRRAVAEAIVAGGLPFAEEGSARVVEQLDHYASDWSTMRRETCVAERERSEDLALRRACLGDRLAELAALADVLSEPAGPLAERALPATMELTRVERCSDGAYLAARKSSWTDQALGEQVLALRERLAEARALERAGRFDDGLTVAAEVAAEAAALGDRPLLAASRLRLGSLHRVAGRWAEAERELLDAFVDARWSRLDPTAIDSAVLLTYVVGVDLARPDEGLVWSRIAEAEIGPEGEHSEAFADLLNNIGNIYAAKSDPQQAKQYLERAIAVAIESYGADHLRVAKYRGNLSPVLGKLGDPEQAVAMAQQAASTAELALGREHPNTAVYRNNLCTALHGAGRLAEATSCVIEVLERQERVLGPDHPNLAIALNNAGAFMHLQGRDDEAYRYWLRARALMRATVPDEHPYVAGVEYNLGTAAREEGRHEEAVDHHRRALAIREKLQGIDHVDVADSCAEIADSLVALGRFDEAEQLLHRALAIQERGIDKLMVANVRARIGLLDHARGRDEDARRELEAGLAVLEREHADAEITKRARSVRDALAQRTGPR
ncbi:MAG TPA: serine/threonine-protein kinase [Nannocystaceae bacterium]|nr:serine/threonine-protein kinase [Nannocystaceae bacterium]